MQQLELFPQNLSVGNGTSNPVSVTVPTEGLMAQPKWSTSSNINTDFTDMYTATNNGGWGIFSLSNSNKTVTFNESAITSSVKTQSGFWQAPDASPWKAPVVFAAPSAGLTETSFTATLNGNSVSNADLPFTSLNTDSNYNSASDALAWLPENMATGNWVFTVTWSDGMVRTYNVDVTNS